MAATELAGDREPSENICTHFSGPIAPCINGALRLSSFDPWASFSIGRATTSGDPRLFHHRGPSDTLSLRATTMPATNLSRRPRKELIDLLAGGVQRMSRQLPFCVSETLQWIQPRNKGLDLSDSLGQRDIVVFDPE